MRGVAVEQMGSKRQKRSVSLSVPSSILARAAKGIDWPWYLAEDSTA